MDFLNTLPMLVLMLAGVAMCAVCYTTKRLHWTVRILAAITASFAFGWITWYLFSSEQYPAMPNVLLLGVATLGIGLVVWLIGRELIEGKEMSITLAVLAVTVVVLGYQSYNFKNETRALSLKVEAWKEAAEPIFEVRGIWPGVEKTPALLAAAFNPCHPFSLAEAERIPRHMCEDGKPRGEVAIEFELASARWEWFFNDQCSVRPENEKFPG